MNALLLCILILSAAGAGLVLTRELAETKSSAARLLDVYAEMLAESRLPPPGKPGPPPSRAPASSAATAAIPASEPARDSPGE